MKTSVYSGARSFALAMIVMIVPMFATSAVHADDDWSFKWGNGFKLDSSDKAFKLKFGGRIMADYTFANLDDTLGTGEDGFEFRRARLFVSGTVYERFEFKAQYDFAGGDADFKDVYIGIVNDWGTLRFGHYKEYFSLEELTSSKYITFLERSLPIEAFAPSRNSGIGVHGKSGDKLNWGVGAFYDADDFGVSQSEDQINLTGRIAFRPIFEDKGKRMVHIGLSATSKDRGDGETFRFRARPEAHFASRFVDTGSFQADSANIYDIELAGVFDSFWVAAEYLSADIDAPAFGDPSFDGGYLQLGYFLTGEHRRYKTSSGTFDRQKPEDTFGKDGGRGAWEIAFRYSTLDLNDGAISGGEQDDWTIGVNWYPNPATRLMINWVHADVDLEGEADYILVRWQVDF